MHVRRQIDADQGSCARTISLFHRADRETPNKILLPGASKEALKNLPEFKYHA
jgi:hypothetical protein